MNSIIKSVVENTNTVANWALTPTISCIVEPRGQEPLTLGGHLGIIKQAKFQNKSSFLASGDDLGFVHFYDAAIGENLITGVKLKNKITKLCWSNNDKHLAIGKSHGEFANMESPA
jgi:hypothetical protein